MPSLQLSLGHMAPHGGQAHVDLYGLKALGKGQELPRCPDHRLLSGFGKGGHARSQAHAAEEAATAAA